MSDAAPIDEAAELARYRQAMAQAGPSAGQIDPATELARFRQAQNEQASAKFLASYPGAAFQEAKDNPEAVDAGTRAVASLPVSGPGKLHYLRSKFGAENVQLAPGGQLIVKSPNSGKWMSLNKGGLDWGDVADLLGPTIEAVPQVAAGIATSGASPAVSIPVAGAAGAVGNLARQGLAAAVTGEQMSASDRAIDAGISGVSGALGEGVVRGVGAAASRFLTPSGKAGALVDAAVKRVPDATAEGLALRNEFNVPLTAGQVTKDQDILQKEALQRQIGRGVNAGHEALDARTQALQDAAFGLADQVSGATPQGASAVTKGLANVRNATLKSMSAARAQEAKQLFGAVPSDVQIDVTPTLDALDFWINKKSGQFQTDPGKALVSQLREWKADIGKLGEDPAEVAAGPQDFSEQHFLDSATPPGPSGPPMISANGLQRALETFGEYSKSGDIIKDMDRSEGAKVGGSILASLQKSLNDAVDAGQSGATELRVARDAYAARSQAMKDFDNAILSRSSKLAKGAGGNPAALVDSIANGKSFDSADVGKTIAIANQTDPNLASNLRGAVLRRIMTPAQGETMSGGQMWAKIMQPDRQSMLDALFVGDPETRAKINRLADVAKRSVMGPYREGSQTGMVLNDLMSSLPIGVAATGNVGGAAGIAASVGLWKKASNIITTSDGMTKLLQTKEGVDALFDLTTPKMSAMRQAGKYGAATISRALARIVELGATETEPGDTSK